MNDDNKRFARHFEGGGNDKNQAERPTDYSKDPKFNQAAALRAELDFYAKMDKNKGLDDVLERGERSRKSRSHKA